MPGRRRRSAKTRPQPLPPGLIVGASVRVKAGVKDPDYGTALTGWQGRATTIEDDGIVEIAWDSVTLRAMPAASIDRAEEEGLDWSTMRLYGREVEVVPARDTAAQAQKAKKTLAEQHAWAHLGPEGQRIGQVLAGIDPDDVMKALRAWRKHLQAKLTFPFEAVVSEHSGPLRVGERVRVLGLNEVVDDLYGLIADIYSPRGASAYPLCDLEVTPKKSPHYQLVDDYAVWFANR